MRLLRSVFALLCVLSRPFVLPAAAGEPAPTLRLATELSGDGDHEGAAVEFRRLALEATEATGRGGFYWAAAHEYWLAGQYDTADKMLNRAENESPALAPNAMLLRGENAASQSKWKDASFYLESVLKGGTNDRAAAVASRRLSAVYLAGKDVSAAREALAKSAEKHDDELAAIDQYARGRNKRPMVGGLLGLIPGLGYMYAGEYANGLRSLLLNGLFIFGMVNTGERDEWGAFAAITFFELTWYSGSVYGGIDASHRYNDRRLQQCIDRVEGTSGFEPDYGQLPVVSLRFQF